MDSGDLKTRRLSLGLSQEKLAQLLGVTTTTAARWERGEVTPPPYLSLALDKLAADQAVAAGRVG